MYQYQPERKNSISSILLLIFALVAVVLLFLSVTLEYWTGLLQLGAILSLVGEVAVFSRYFRRSYIYRIQTVSEDAPPDFTVSEINGRNSITVCRFSLGNVLSIEKKSSKSKYAHEKIYNYCVDIAPKEAYILRFEEGREKYSLIISPDEKMISIITSYLEYGVDEE